MGISCRVSRQCCLLLTPERALDIRQRVDLCIFKGPQGITLLTMAWARKDERKVDQIWALAGLQVGGGVVYLAQQGTRSSDFEAQVNGSTRL